MKKLFLVLSSLSMVGISSVIPNLINIQAVPKQVYIKDSNVDRTANNLVLRTEPINLTEMGIKDNNGLNEYFAIELVDFQVNLLDGVKIVNDGWKWGAKMSEGEGDWALISKYDIVKSGFNFRTTIERKHSLWYDENGSYNLALIYRFNSVASVGHIVWYGSVKAETGTLVKFY